MCPWMPVFWSFSVILSMSFLGVRNPSLRGCLIDAVDDKESELRRPTEEWWDELVAPDFHGLGMSKALASIIGVSFMGGLSGRGASILRCAGSGRSVPVAGLSDAEYWNCGAGGFRGAENHPLAVWMMFELIPRKVWSLLPGGVGVSKTAPCPE